MFDSGVRRRLALKNGQGSVPAGFVLPFPVLTDSSKSLKFRICPFSRPPENYFSGFSDRENSSDCRYASYSRVRYTKIHHRKRFGVILKAFLNPAPTESQPSPGTRLGLGCGIVYFLIKSEKSIFHALEAPETSEVPRDPETVKN